MNPTEKVITFDQAKKLKELGFEKESQYTWRKPGPDDKEYIEFTEKPPMDWPCEYYPAYDINEMKEVMKNFPYDYEHDFEMNWIAYPIDSPDVIKEMSSTLAEALGELLIYLLENDKLK